jgi:isopentenyl phosphate kinase
VSTPPRRSISVLKIGGSLLTDRRRYQRPRLRAIHRFAAAVAKWLTPRRRDVVIVLGGGSFGHNVVHKHELDPGGAHRTPAETFELTAALYQLKLLFARAMKRWSVPCMPLQETALFVDRGGMPTLSSACPLEVCFATGYVPLLTGGLIAGEQDSCLRIASSDRIPLSLCSAFDVRRVAMLTDQPGVLLDGRVVPRISQEMFESTMALVPAATKLDFTGGMRGKIAAAFELAHMGVETVIAGGSASLESLFSRRPPGTLIVAVPRVAGPPPPSVSPRNMTPGGPQETP